MRLGWQYDAKAWKERRTVMFDETINVLASSVSGGCCHFLIEVSEGRVGYHVYAADLEFRTAM